MSAQLVLFGGSREQKRSDDVEARRLRDLGIARAVDHADAVTPKWSEGAFEFLCRFIEQRGGLQFTNEDVRVAAIGVIDDPPDKRAWGGILSRARRARLIDHVGTATALSPKVHKSIINVWRASACKP